MFCGPGCFCRSSNDTLSFQMATRSGFETAGTRFGTPPPAACFKSEKESQNKKKKRKKHENRTQHDVEVRELGQVGQACTIVITAFALLSCSNDCLPSPGSMVAFAFEVAFFLPRAPESACGLCLGGDSSSSDEMHTRNASRRFLLLALSSLHGRQSRHVTQERKKESRHSINSKTNQSIGQSVDTSINQAPRRDGRKKCENVSSQRVDLRVNRLRFQPTAQAGVQGSPLS